MAGKKQNLEVSYADTYPIAVTLEINDQPYDLSGATVTLEVWDIEYKSLKFTLSGAIDNDPQTGKVVFVPAGAALTTPGGSYGFKVKVTTQVYVLTHTRGTYKIHP